LLNRVERYRQRLEQLRSRVGPPSTAAATQLITIIDALDRYAPRISPVRLTWIWLTDAQARRKQTTATLRRAIADAGPADRARLAAVSQDLAAATTWHFIQGNILCAAFLILALPLIVLGARITRTTLHDFVIRRIDPDFIVEKAMAHL
jgi:hypothetical protein